MDSYGNVVKNKNFYIFEENIKRLNIMSSMEIDWDGYCGKSFSESAIILFKNIINQLNYQTEILPTNFGGMGLIYRKLDDSYMEFEVFEDRVEMIYIPQMNAKFITEETTIEKDKFVNFINSWLSKFYGQ